MLEPISIGTYTSPNVLFNRLNSELEFLQREGLPLHIDINKVGNFTFLGCEITGDNTGTSEEEVFNITKFYIANCLADIIVNEWESRIIKKIVRNTYYYYNEEEKQTILNKAKEILNPLGSNSYHQNERKEKVMVKILEYLDMHKELILEGFVNFRLKDYQNELEDVVNSAVDEFLLEKEYMEFIRLLRYFVDIQEPRVKTIQVIFKQTGKFNLLDENDKPVNNDYLEGFVVDLLDNEINYEDLLISALITLAPKEVILHLENGVVSGDIVTTIKNVFSNRVVMCSGCSKCRHPEK
ncbi:putative sporulation protein YtxC [Thermanaerosceptrum fracticalcis]|uniref:putative sporulation protein YtxC n=1 Tax=Thermanaerosceptrum fracticalcis TaxID=1712410 RepID=UPI00068D1120|nr:putative sporulation protein YtxC [Thermanaerosceptrum fracticalcis]